MCIYCIHVVHVYFLKVHINEIWILLVFCLCRARFMQKIKGTEKISSVYYCLVNVFCHDTIFILHSFLDKLSQQYDICCILCFILFLHYNNYLNCYFVIKHMFLSYFRVFQKGPKRFKKILLKKWKVQLINFPCCFIHYF